MRAGDLTERLAYQESVDTRDTFNAVTKSWSTTATVWGSVREVSSREQIAAGRQATLAVYEVRIRIGDVTPVHQNQFVWRGKTMLIETVTVLQTDGEIRMRCVEVTL